jgi:hypothetical protein
MSFSDQMNREFALSKVRRRTRSYIADGLRCKEQSSSTRLIYCPTCKGPVVDTPLARRRHADDFFRCRAAILEGLPENSVDNRQPPAGK